MLTCITCSKQRREEEDDEEERGSKEAVKSLSSQIKDMALKASGSHKGKREGRVKRLYTDFGETSKGVIPYTYAQTGSSSSTPAWDFMSTGHHGSRRDTSELVVEDESKEWMAQVEPGVEITFVSLPQGGNDLKRIRFSRETFDKWEAQRWWGENYERIMELYNVQRFNQTPARSEDGRDSTYSKVESVRESPPRYKEKGPREAASSRDEASVSVSVSDIETEWIEEDEGGVYITIRQLIDGSRELRRVRFSREKFGEVDAKLWWESNRDRIQEQYLS